MPRSFTRRTGPIAPWYHRRLHQRWSADDLAMLQLLASGGMPARHIARLLGRSTYAVQRMAWRRGIPLSASVSRGVQHG